MSISTEGSRIQLLIATFFGVGCAPLAPGTVGSLAALPLAFGLLQVTIVPAALMVTGLYFLGLWSANHLERVSGQHDAQIIVIDEVVGVCVSALLLNWWFLGAIDPDVLLLLSFLSFRFFDVLKPWPVSWVDRTIGGGVGVMVDDLVAAVMGVLAVAGGYYILLLWTA